jgi:hypothetical protein
LRPLIRAMIANRVYEIHKLSRGLMNVFFSKRKG